MSALSKTRLNGLQYLAIENAAEFRSEFFDGEMFAMAGASPGHNTIRENLGGELYARIKGGRCRSYSVDQRVKVERTGLYTYPDILVVCGTPVFAHDDANSIINPTAIIEILSPSTEKYDRGGKFAHYRTLDSLREYLLISQDEFAVELHVWEADGSWSKTAVTGREGILKLPSLGIGLPLAKIYEGVKFKV